MDLASNTASVDTHPFSPLRREDDALLRGIGKFGCDIELPKAFHIAFVRSVEELFFYYTRSKMIIPIYGTAPANFNTA